ncbi:MAG TPA: 16S rRNA (cytidine(1402)-2'-O)-methyltransferase [Alphaproteobacteria bacterium]|nr:16S rRNA (cytidine(1402)-2'-O)-methyltransferase [Alphaproteobacteria bacterium]
MGEPNHSAAIRKPRAALYVIATPIGNLGDISRRQVETLAAADILACEDTRVTRQLCAALKITPRRLVRYDDHTAQRVRPRLIEAIRRGENVALVTDAGTPLIADPGYKLVRAAHAANLPVIPIPGPSAAIAALSVAGLPSDRFMFGGFLPAKPAARRSALSELPAFSATLIFFEAPHRVAASLADMAQTFGPREAVVARELTKLFEEIRRGTLAELAAFYAAAGPPKGEVVIVVGPPPVDAARASVAAEADIDRALGVALGGMSLRDATAAVAAATGRPRREIYKRALALGRGGTR